MIGSSGASLATGAMISAPSTGCAFMIIRSSLVSRSCLSRTVVRHADLADVVEQAAPLQRLELRVADAHLPPDVDRDLLDPPAVAGRERIPLVHRLGQAPDGLREHLAHLDEPVMRHRVVYSGSANRRVAHHPRPAARRCCAISHANGARASEVRDRDPRVSARTTRAEVQPVSEDDDRRGDARR